MTVFEPYPVDSVGFFTFLLLIVFNDTRFGDNDFDLFNFKSNIKLGSVNDPDFDIT